MTQSPVGPCIFYLGLLGAAWTTVAGSLFALAKMVVEALHVVRPGREERYPGGRTADPAYRWVIVWGLLAVVWSLPHAPGFVALVVVSHVLTSPFLLLIVIALIVMLNRRDIMGSTRTAGRRTSGSGSSPHSSRSPPCRASARLWVSCSRDRRDLRVTTVAAAVADLLAVAGARRCYTVPGESFLSLIDEVDRHPGLQLVSVRHESGAAFMADADARLTGVPAVAMASRGPGSSNLAIGVHTAHQDSTPMIVLLGQVDSQLRGREAFQEVDLTAFYDPITKWAVTAERAEDVPALVAEGWRIATSGRPGPVAIAVPSDFVDAEFPGTVMPPVAQPATTAVEDLAARLLAARRPIAIAGEGARPARDRLVAAAERFGIGVCTSFRRQDAFPVDHPNFLGHLALATPDATVDAVAGADLLLVIGTRLDEVTTQRYRLPAPGCEVVPIGRYGHGGIDADPADVLAALARWEGPARPVDWTETHAAVDAWSTPPTVDADGGVHPAAVIAALHRHLPSDGIVTNDAGNFAAFLHRYWRFPPTTTQLAPVNGAMGYAVPAAVAAAVAEPERTAVAVVGDGGVLMTGQEIETAVRLGAPVVVLVLQNGMYGTIAMHQARDLGRTSGVDIGAVDLVRLAEGLGAAAYGITDVGQLDDALHRAVTGRRPAVVAVRTDPEIITPTATLAGLLERVPV